jgi:hypothetical protein
MDRKRWQVHQPTVSMTMRDLAWKYVSFSALMGVLIGHWFFPSVNPAHHRVGNVLPILIALYLCDLAWIKFGSGRMAWRYPGVWFTLGVVIGAKLWAQRLLGVSAPF